MRLKVFNTYNNNDSTSISTHHFYIISGFIPVIIKLHIGCNSRIQDHTGRWCFWLIIVGFFGAAINIDGLVGFLLCCRHQHQLVAQCVCGVDVVVIIGIGVVFVVDGVIIISVIIIGTYPELILAVNLPFPLACFWYCF